MPNTQVTKHTAERWSSEAQAFRAHQRRCATCRACTCDPPNPAELCEGGAALAAAVDAAADAHRAAVASPTGWRF